MMPFTHYIIFGEQKTGLTPEESRKAWSDYEKSLKKLNLKMLGPFGPFGVSEDTAIILEGTLESFEKYIGSEAMQKCPSLKNRTISLWKES